MLLLRVSGSRVGAALLQEVQRLICELTDWLMAQVTLCCYYGCRDLESVLRCFKKYQCLICELTDWLMAQVTLCCYYGCRDLESVLRCIKKNGASLEHLELSRSSLLRMDPLLFRNVLTSATRQIFIQFKPVLLNRKRRKLNFLP